MTPEERSNAARRAAETRRKRAALPETVNESPVDVVPGLRVQLVRDGGVTLQAAQGRTAGSPAALAPLLAEYIGDQDREHFVVALLDIRRNVIGLHTVSIGCLSSAIVHPRETFKPAIIGGAAAVVVSHNHPSGDPEPSAEDVALTRRLSAAGQLLGIEVLDHVVVTRPGGRFVSLKERGIL